MTADSADIRDPRPHWAVRMNWRNRSIFFAMLAGIVGIQLHDVQAPPIAWLLLVLQFLVYPHLVYWRARRHAHPRRAEVQNMVLDGFCFGIWFVGLGFPLWICFILFTGVCMNLSVFMGRTGLAYLAGTIAAGMLAGAAWFWPLAWKPDTSLPVSLLCMLVLTAFLAVFAHDGYRRSRGLYESRTQMRRQLDEIRELQSRLHDLALRDPLTGLFNRRHLHHALAASLAECQRTGQPLAVLMIDIDHFKQVNDTHGHPAGDAMLQALAQLLQAHCRTGDLTTRMGGEEFLMVLENTGLELACERAQTMRAAFEALEVVHGATALRATLSCGLAAFPGHGDEAPALIQAADQALYAAKVAGRNRIAVPTPALQAG